MSDSGNGLVGAAAGGQPPPKPSPPAIASSVDSAEERSRACLAEIQAALARHHCALRVEAVLPPPGGQPSLQIGVGALPRLAVVGPGAIPAVGPSLRRQPEPDPRPRL